MNQLHLWLPARETSHFPEEQLAVNGCWERGYHVFVVYTKVSNLPPMFMQAMLIQLQERYGEKQVFPIVNGT